MQQLGWLHATPRRANGSGAAEPARSRLTQMVERGDTPDLPPLGAEAYLVDHLLEVGPAMPAGMGDAPLSYSEIHAYTLAAGVRLAPWEARALRMLSREYLSARAEGEDADCPPPYIARPSADRAARVSAALAGALRGRKAPKQAAERTGGAA